ncbi:MAG TPA: HD domain-containing protein, partial [Arcobacter sp.]|nr:HD domain-containing protein [Arcobacter sp.]
LIYLGILLHDIGKFQKNYSKKLNWRVIYTFNQHEVYSQEIIQNDLYPLLHDNYGLTDKQIEYIAMCARYHFELGFIREVGKKSKYGYSAEFAKSQDFKQVVINALPAFEEYKIEVGVLFLADSYAKTDIAFENRSDKEILDDLKYQDLNPKLIYAVKQKPVNLEVAKSYFDVIYNK